MKTYRKELDQVVKKKNAKIQKGPSVSKQDLLVVPRPQVCLLLGSVMLPWGLLWCSRLQLGSLRPSGIKDMQFIL